MPLLNKFHNPLTREHLLRFLTFEQAQPGYEITSGNHCPEIRPGFEQFQEFFEEKSQERPCERKTLKMDGYGTCEFFRSGSLKPKSAAKVIQTVSNSGQPEEFRGLRRVF